MGTSPLPICGLRLSSSGFKVATTNQAASSTVTAWEKINQILRILNFLPNYSETHHTMVTRHTLTGALDTLLQPERFKDYGPNGLQVEGKSEVKRIVSGVTASWPSCGEIRTWATNWFSAKDGSNTSVIDTSPKSSAVNASR